MVNETCGQILEEDGVSYTCSRPVGHEGPFHRDEERHHIWSEEIEIATVPEDQAK